MRKCPICGKEIDKRSPKAKYCSIACKYKAYRKGISQKPVLRKCEICNKEFLSVNNAKYCSSKCNYKSYRLRNKDKVKETWRKYRIKSGRSKTIWTEDRINTCAECGKQFHPPKTVPFKKYCSPNCRAKHIQREWKIKNKQRAKEIMTKYDKSDKGKERRRRRYNKIREYQKEWLNKHSEKTAQYSRSYLEKDPERAKRVRQKYKKSIKGIFANRKRSHIHRSLTKKNYDHNRWIPLLEEQGKKCPICGTKYDPKLRNMELGHIFPMKKFPALDSDPENMIPICKKCNRKMRDNLFTDFCVKNKLPIPLRVTRYVKKQKLLWEFIK